MGTNGRSSDIIRALKAARRDSPEGLLLVPRRVTDDFLSVAFHVVGDFERRGLAARWFSDRLRAVVDAGAESVVLSCERFMDGNGHYSLDAIMTPVLRARNHVVVLAAVPQLLHETATLLGFASFVTFASNIGEGASRELPQGVLYGLPRQTLCPVCESLITVESPGISACPWCAASFDIEESGLLTMRHRPHPAELAELLSSASEIPLVYPDPVTAGRSVRAVDDVADSDLEGQHQEIPELDGAE